MPVYLVRMQLRGAWRRTSKGGAYSDGLGISPSAPVSEVPRCVGSPTKGKEFLKLCGSWPCSAWSCAPKGHSFNP